MIRNVAYTYALFAIRTVVPILALPLLSHTVGAAGLGSILAGQSLGLLGGLVIQFGFHQSAARSVGSETDKSAIAITVCQVLWSQVITCLIATILVVVASINTAALSVIHFSPFSVALVAVGTGLSPAWYFRGTGRAHIGVIFELVGQVLTVAMLMTLVRTPEDSAIALGAFGVGPTLMTVVALLFLLYEIKAFHWPERHGIYARLEGSFSLFIVRLSSTGFTMGAAWLASLMTGPREAAYFGVAAKIVGALTSFSQPVLFSLLPVISRVALRSRSDALCLAAKWGCALLALGLAAAIGVQMFADLFISLLFSNDMMPAAGVLSLLAWVCVIAALRDTLADLILVPLHKDRLVAGITISGTLTGIIAALLLAPLFGSYGMSGARLIGEMTMVLLLIVAVYVTFRDKRWT